MPSSHSKTANNERIAQNALLLYVRMFLVMAITLYISRVILGTLGVVDYGIYNVVGGVVTIFTFLNAAMTTGTQRYITFALARGGEEALRKVFSTTLMIHGLISLLVLILSETVGLWFVITQLIIPPDRYEAAIWVYHAAVLTCVTLIMNVPYHALTIAHERMAIYAYLSILDIVLQLGIVYLLLLYDADRLIIYAFLFLGVKLFIRLLYGIYCNRHFPESRFRWQWDRSLVREMLSFAGWNLWGNMAQVAFTQGLNLLLNLFFGPVVNAARGIAMQVQAAVYQFSFNFQTAINPQITKTYAQGELSYMHLLVFRSSKFTFYLIYLFAIPIFMATEMILTFWLKSVPPHTISFTRLILCVTVLDAVANPLMVAATASGRIRLYQMVLGGIQLGILPVSYIALRMGGTPEVVFVVHLIFCVITFIARLLIVRPLIRLSIREYIRQSVWPCLRVVMVSLIPVGAFFVFYPATTLGTCVACLIVWLCLVTTIYFIGLTAGERLMASHKISTLLYRLRLKK